jgi:hypothetical protein
MTDEDALARAERDAAAEARAAAAMEPSTDAAADAADGVANDEDPSADYALAFTPRNVAVGLAIVAGVVAFALSRRRRASRADDD